MGRRKGRGERNDNFEAEKAKYERIDQKASTETPGGTVTRKEGTVV